MSNNTSSCGLFRRAIQALPRDTKSGFEYLKKCLGKQAVYKTDAISCLLSDKAGEMALTILDHRHKAIIGTVLISPDNVRFENAGDLAMTGKWKYGTICAQRDIFASIMGHENMPFYRYFEILNPNSDISKPFEHRIVISRTKYVEMAYYSMHKAASTLFMGTAGLHSCVALALHNKEHRIGILSHMDIYTYAYLSLNLMFDEVRKKWDISSEGFKAQITGGIKGISETFLVNLALSLDRFGVVLEKTDLFRDKSARHVLFNALNGRLYGTVRAIMDHPDVYIDPEMKCLVSARYS